MKKLFAFLVLFPALSWGCSVEEVMRILRPGASYTIVSGNYAGIVWTDQTQVKPTQTEFDQAMTACTSAAMPTPQQYRNDGIALLSAPDGLLKLIKAVLLVLFDENNNTREWIQSFKGAVAAATSLADLKTRVAALPDMPDRTIAQAKTAVQNKINSGDSD